MIQDKVLGFYVHQNVCFKSHFDLVGVVQFQFDNLEVSIPLTPIVLFKTDCSGLNIWAADWFTDFEIHLLLVHDVLQPHIAGCLQHLILFCLQRFTEMFLFPVSMIECRLPSVLSKNDKVWRNLECPVEGSIVAEHQWSQINFPNCCLQLKNLLQIFVDLSICRFLLKIESRKLSTGFRGQFHDFV